MCYECENSTMDGCYDEDRDNGLADYDDEDELGYDKDPMMGDGNGNVDLPAMTVADWAVIVRERRLQANVVKEEKVPITNAHRKAALRRQAEQLLERLDRLERLPDENPFKDGDVFKLSKYGSYTYVVLYIEGYGFYTTAKTQNKYFSSWTSFCDWAGEQAFTIEKATAWETIVE